MKDVNKTIELVATGGEVMNLIMIGKLLSVMDYDGKLYTRPYLQDLAYCSLGVTATVANVLIDTMVDNGIFKLID